MKGLERTTELPKENKKRMERRVAEDEVYGTHHKWIMTQPCELRNHPAIRCTSYPDRAPIEGHHLKCVGSGGKDRNNEVPACNAHHDHFHWLGSVSAASDFYGRDFRSIAVQYTERFDEVMERVNERVEQAMETTHGERA